MKVCFDYDVEEALGIIWKSIEVGDKSFSKIKEKIESGVTEGILDKLLEQGHVIVENGNDLALTQSGEKIARDITRRHRLAERLFADVIELRKEDLDKNACEFEHIISHDVTDAICTLLGHPQYCPHGSKIPSGECCKKAEGEIEAIVVPLTKLAVGQSGVVAYIVTGEHKFIHKIFSLGVVPGATIKLHQKSPSFVIIAGQTQIAIDSAIAGQIYIRKK
ncbi:MAG: metal-dependent transcriptional regulator [Endomicrobiales bacterium]|nr:metal-dependent transcriptional regulator [Endomicrobiales bacterium]